MRRRWYHAALGGTKTAVRVSRDRERADHRIVNAKIGAS
jgi:hypothetical protein